MHYTNRMYLFNDNKYVKFKKKNIITHDMEFNFARML